MKRPALILVSLALAAAMIPAMGSAAFASTTTAINSAATKLVPTGTTSLKASWSSVPGASKYVIYQTACAKNASYKKVATTTSTKYTFKHLKANTGYKCYVKALNSKGKAITTMASVHAFTNNMSKDKKYSNVTSVKLNKSTLNLEVGKSSTIKATLKTYKNKKPMDTCHGKKVRFFSSNPAVAKVSSTGKVKAVAEGSCNIYAMAINGIKAKVSVKVACPNAKITILVLGQGDDGTLIADTLPEWSGAFADLSASYEAKKGTSIGSACEAWLGEERLHSIFLSSNFFVKSSLPDGSTIGGEFQDNFWEEYSAQPDVDLNDTLNSNLTLYLRPNLM